MPYYWRRRTRWRPYRRYRYRPFRRDTRRRPFRQPLRTTFRRRRRRVRKRRFYKNYKRKLKTIILREWQPKTIRKCKIRGYKCLFQGAHGRFSNNYAQFQLSYTPEYWPGGGGWGLFVFSLDALYEEFLHLNNWWTASNKGLPLARYKGCTFKFFRQPNTDYIINYYTCFPMTDTPLTHANSTPQNMLLARRRLIIPSLKRKPRGKPYIKKRIYPPSQMSNKWYFQTDICKTSLLLLTATATDLDSYYISPFAESNSITLYCLNPLTFQKKNFQRPSETTGYQPRAGLYLYGTKAAGTPKYGDLIYLGWTGPMREGEPFKLYTQSTYTKEHWGNPFHPDWISQNYKIYKSNTQYTAILTDTNKDKPIESTKLTLAEAPLLLPVRYTPNKDTGQNNVVYLVNNIDDNAIAVPNDNNIKIEGFPLHISLWGYLDWQRKLAYLHHIDSDYLVVIQTDFFEPKESFYILLDKAFADGHGPYNTPAESISLSNKTHWYPKIMYQQQSIDTLCMTTPGACKGTNKKSIQAHCEYKFNFLWGGCPAPMENISNPCSQPKFPVPNNILQRLQVQDPETPPETEIHYFDERHSTITKRAIQRIQDYTTTKECSLTDTSKSDPRTKTQTQALQEALQSEDQEEEKKTLHQQLQHHRLQQQLLKRCLLRLIQPQDIE